MFRYSGRTVSQVEAPFVLDSSTAFWSQPGSIEAASSSCLFVRDVQVVPTAYSLKVLLQRSREAQRVDGWVEYFDPDTGAFWYVEEVGSS